MVTNIYISAHDSDLVGTRGLSKYLRQLTNKYPISIYSKDEISVGENIVRQVSKFIRFSKIIVCILTVDYLTDCQEEIDAIFDFSDDEKIIVPVILKKCIIRNTQFEHFKQIIFEDFKEDGLDFFWNHIAEIIEELYRKKIQSSSDIFNEELIPKAFAGASISNQVRLITINADIKNDQNIGSNRNEKGIMIRVVGESMVPDIQNLDIVLCRKVETKTNAYSASNKKMIPLLERKKFYVVETRNDGVMLKKVQMVGNNLILHSSNIDFDAIIIDKDDIISIWEVVRLLRAFEEGNK